MASTPCYEKVGVGAPTNNPVVNAVNNGFTT
jgi:hypothetical protein